MSWNDLVIEKSRGIVTEKNIDKFNCDFWCAIDNEHNSDIPDGEFCEFAIDMWGMKLKGHYIAGWIGDNDYPNETEPTEIQLDYLEIVKVAQKRNFINKNTIKNKFNIKR